jgi:hypothetical protein
MELKRVTMTEIDAHSIVQSPLRVSAYRLTEKLAIQNSNQRLLQVTEL